MVNAEMNNPSGIIWRDEFSTGIAAIDHEHQELVGLVNHVMILMQGEEPTDVVADALADVNAKITAHFALEELVMREVAYSDYEPHKEDHERLLDDIRDIMDAYEDGSYAERCDEFLQHLTAWFVNHFSTMDAKLHHIVDGG